jgi:hypothetical protein
VAGCCQFIFWAFKETVTRKELEKNLDNTAEGKDVNNDNFFLNEIFGGFFSYCIQHSLICRPSDSTVPTDAGIEQNTK